MTHTSASTTEPWLPVRSGGIRDLVAWTGTDETKYIASCGRDGSIRVWNADTENMIGSPLSANSAVQALACWENEYITVLASAGSDGAFSTWNPLEGTRITRVLTDHAGGMRTLTGCSDRGKRYLATGGYDGTIRLWDPNSGMRIGRPLAGHSAPIAALISWQDRQGRCRIASGSDDSTIRVWTPESAGSLVCGPLRAHTGAVGALALWHDHSGRTNLVSASLDGTIRVWDPETGTCIGGPFKAGAVGIRSICCWINSDGDAVIASGDFDGGIRLWDPTGGKAIGEPCTASRSGISSLTCWPAPTVSQFVSGGLDGIVRVWDLATRTQVREIVTGHVAAVWALTAWQDSDATRLAIAGADGIVRVCDPDKGVIVSQSPSPHGPGVWALTCWKDETGERKIASGSLDGTICVWNATCLPIGSPFGGHQASVSALAWWRVPGGAIRLASAGDDALIRIWDPDSGTIIGTPMAGHAGGLLTLTAWQDSSGHTRLASAGSDRTIRIWDPDTGVPAGEPLSVLTQEVWALCSWHIPDGSPRVASGEFADVIRLWDPVAGTPIGEPLIGGMGAVRAFTCWKHKEGSFRIASGGDSGIHIWDTDTGASVRGWQVPGGVRALTCWRADDGSTRLASGGDDGTVWLWDADRGLALRTIEVGEVNIWGLSDAPARVDVLSRGPLVEAIVAQLRPHVNVAHASSGPSVVTVEGPWGSGKSTLMDLVRQRLAQTRGLASASADQRIPRLTVREATRFLRRSPDGLSATTGTQRGNGPEREIITAWFNPWAHQSGHQIWAGLTNAIIEASEPILCPSESERERYWFIRNMNRIDRHALRRTLQRRILSPVLGIALVTVALPLTVSLVEFGKSLNILGRSVSAATLALALPATILLVGSLHTLGRYWRGFAASYLPDDLFRGPVGEASFSTTDGESSAYTDPLRRASRGSLYLHQHDVKVVLSDLAAAGYDLVVFVDDLDRCTASTTAEVFEAINLFLSSLNSDGLSARFVIGIDSSVIAAHLDQVYSGLNIPQVARQGEDPSAGWTYLRKLVQLPVVIPRVSNEALNDFIDAAAGLVDNKGVPKFPKSGESVVSAEPQAPQLTSANPEVPLMVTSGLPSAAAPILQRKAVAQLVPWRTMEQHPLVRELMQERLAAQPDGSIREAKRLINVWQLYARILTRTRPLGTSLEEISRARTLVLLAEILVRWPSLQRYFLRRTGKQIGLRSLADSARADDSWTLTLEQLGIDIDHHHAAVAGLRLLLCEYDGGAVAQLAEELL
jgi:WD40 repeat protein